MTYKHNSVNIAGTYALVKGVISNDLEWLSEIFNDKKHRAVSLHSWASCVTCCQC